jgi:F-type H+/Na+-transporting ATPase subunit alpha
LKQGQYEPMPVGKQVMQLYAGTNRDDAQKRGWLRDIPVSDVVRWAKEFLAFCDAKYGSIQKDIEEKKEMTAEIKTALNKALTEFNETFQKTPGAKV